MKSTVFNGQRFWSYFKYDLTQMWRNHVRAAIGIGLAGLIAYFVVVLFNLVFEGVWQGPGLAGRFVVFGIAAFAFELYQTRTYGYLTDKRKGSAWLMLPASTFEKWLSMMLMTLILLPILFLLSSGLVDSFLCLVDPTIGKSMLSVLGGGLKELNENLIVVNGEYMTDWNAGIMLWPALVGLWTSLLFFLLCGLCFKRNKILGGFVILFVVSVVFSSITGIQMADRMEEYEDFATAETAIRHIINTATLIEAFVVAGLAGGVFYRLKTLKH